MAVFLLLSFVLHIVSFYFIILLYTRYQNVKKIEEKQEQLLKEAEDSLAMFLLELKEENKQFLEQLEQNSAKPGSFDLEKLVTQLEDKVEVSTIQKDTSADAEPIDKDAELIEEPKDKRKNLHKQVFQLLEKGYTIDEIAQTLHVGKTEIELVMKFQQND
ncbi:hypothetical protein P4U24_08130 [Aeribacillus composti]|jgi:hypothetical protein|uniref:DUF6115 domain-containing protein n=1 Tax=Aeribacillus TaxID=1055323 RepID=UPI001398212D|nr:hypothetical protein [Aeribacillus composti]BBU39793.1 swarming motility protein SwrB [Aeribacillus pallidus]